MNYGSNKSYGAGPSTKMMTPTNLNAEASQDPLQLLLDLLLSGNLAALVLQLVAARAGRSDRPRDRDGRPVNLGGYKEGELRY